MIQADAHISSPIIAPLPPDSPERLIDRGLMHYEASVAGLAERYRRGETSHTIHTWWARRPHSAIRALVFAALCQEKSLEALRTLQELGSFSIMPASVLASARALLNRHWHSHPPKLLDMFGGGGTIPFEAANLGAKTYTGDANELSVFIQACNLQYSQNLKELDIAEALRSSGTRVLTQLETDTENLFPLRHGSTYSKPFGYLWTYSTQCSHCGYRFYLSRRRWLTKKRSVGIAINFLESEHSQKIQISELNRSNRLDSVWGKGNGTAICPKCHKTNSDITISECQDELIAVASTAPKTGKEFLPPPENSIPPAVFIRNLEETVLAELAMELPASELPQWSGIVNPALYGIKTHADFLNPRQRVVLLLLLKALRDEFHFLCKTYNTHTATHIIGFLSSLVDQAVDWNCRLSMWIPQNEQVGRAFSGPGVPMLWDYVETDQVLHGPANLWSKLDRIVKGASSIPRFPHPVTVTRGYAQKLDYPDNFFDAIVTDPPYYDNIYYSILADFIYAWKRPLLNFIGLTDYVSPTTDMAHELVASRNRSGSAAKAHADYCAQLEQAFREIERVLKADGVFSFIYSHSSIQGWEAVLKAFRASNLIITSVQPLSIERRQRPRAMTSEAINTCVVFVARLRQKEPGDLSLAELDLQVKGRFAEFGKALIQMGWKEKDAALSVFANGVGLLANSAPTEADNLEILRGMATSIRSIFPSFSIKERRSL